MLVSLWALLSCGRQLARLASGMSQALAEGPLHTHCFEGGQRTESHLSSAVAMPHPCPSVSRPVRWQGRRKSSGLSRGRRGGPCRYTSPHPIWWLAGGGRPRGLGPCNRRSSNKSWPARHLCWGDESEQLRRAPMHNACGRPRPRCHRSHSRHAAKRGRQLVSTYLAGVVWE